MKIVVIGGVASGSKAVAKARRLLPQSSIDLYTDDTHVSYSSCGLPYYIEGNLDMIKKAFSNIIINGIKYSEENEELIIKLEGNSFQIINTGAHIDKSDLDKIFEPFYRVEKSRNRKTGGSGLGLHIVKKVLEVHDYKYTIENIENAVKFTIELVQV